MSRMKQLQALAKEAREKGDRDKYEMIRGDIFKEFDFDIGKFGDGGEIKYDKGSQMDQYLEGLDKANKQMKKETEMAKRAFADQAKKIQKSKDNLNKMIKQSKINEKNIMYKNLEKALKSGKLSEKQILNRLAPPKIKAAKRVGNIALGLGTAAFAGAGYEIKKMFDRNMQLGARSKYGSSQDYPERPDTDKFGRKINKKNVGGEVRGIGKAIRGFKFGGIK